MPTACRRRLAIRPADSARGVSDNPRNPARVNPSVQNSTMASGFSRITSACRGLSRRCATAMTRNPLAAISVTVRSMTGSTSSLAANTTSGAPLTVSSPSVTEAEKDLPDRKGRCAVRARSRLGAATAAAASTIATSVACACGSPFDAGAACAAQRSTSSSENPGAAWTSATRSRFSLSVPVLSKQTTSMRPSASTERGTRTSAPNLVSRRAEAACARVATKGIPSGTAATAMAMPLDTAWINSTRRTSPSAPTTAPPVTLTGSARFVSWPS